MLTRVIDLLRTGAWLTRERVIAGSAMAIGGYAAAVALLVATSHDFLDVAGHPLGTDFASFWSAGVLVDHGRAAAAYDWPQHEAAQKAAFGPDAPFYCWSYPPIFLLCAALLGLLPYALSLVAWLVATGAAYVACMRRLLPDPQAPLVALALPATFLNVVHGQNGFLSAALLGTGVLLLDSRPAMAGVLFGALCYKPQMALLLPLGLFAGRHWRALAAMALAVLVLCGATTLLLGADVWRAFESSIPLTQGRVLEEGAAGYYKMVSVFAGVRLLGGSVALAWAVQWLSSAAAAAAVAWAWYSRGPIQLKAALLVSAVPLVTPFALDYDLIVLAIPAALLVKEGLNGAFLPWERAAVVAACLVPAVARVSGAYGVPIAPLASLALFAVVWRRLWR